MPSVKEAAEECGTASVHGLSQQIIAKIHQIKPGAFVVVSHPKIKAANPLTVNLLLQSAANAALVAAVSARNQTIVLNSCFRTVAQQYILRHHAVHDMCGIKIAAKPGHSNHEGGVGIDVAAALSWKPFLEPRSWKRLSGDPPHYDFKGTQELILDHLGVEAFQHLWNEHNPNDKLVTDGKYGNKTQERLEKSPAGGFP
jgi:hypothetical protein